MNKSCRCKSFAHFVRLQPSFRPRFGSPLNAVKPGEGKKTAECRFTNDLRKLTVKQGSGVYRRHGWHGCEPRSTAVTQRKKTKEKKKREKKAVAHLGKLGSNRCAANRVILVPFIKVTSL